MESQEAQWGNINLRLTRRHQDPLDIFIRFILVRGGTVYVLINITLLIWLVQTVLSSNLNEIPRSMYLIIPFLSSNPISNINLVEGECLPGYQRVVLKTFPTVKDINIIRKNLTEWRQLGYHFCIKRYIAQPTLEVNCQSQQIFCHGYCVKSKSECPITRIAKVQKKQQNGQYIQFLQSPTEKGYYQIERGQGKLIVSIIAAYDKKCTNDYHYYDEYDSFSKYVESAQSCGKEGELNSLFLQFDEIPAKNFFYTNNLTNIPLKNFKYENKKIKLGYVPKIQFDVKVDTSCSQTEEKVHKLAKNMFLSISPSFSSIILIGCFVLFAASWIWLIGYYCCEGMIKQKNMIAILMSVIQLIVISYIFYQNKQIFDADQFLNEVHKCIGSSVKSSQHWNFGIESPKSFLMVIYSNIVFLSLMGTTYVLNKWMYVTM